LLKPLLAGLHADGFQAVDECQQLPLESQQLRAGLPEAAVLLGELPHGGEVFGRGGDVLWPALAAIREDGAGMEFAMGAAAVRFSAAAAEGIQRSGQERLAAEKDIQEFRELLLDGQELGAEGAEFTRHELVSRGSGAYTVGYYIYLPTDFKWGCKKCSGGEKRRKGDGGRNRWSPEA
jgi:hypothetical protein